MSQVENGDSVTIIYEGKLDTGENFKSINKDEPFTIIMGNSEAPPTLEQALLGMSVGEQKKTRVPPEEGYGPRQKSLLQELQKSTFGDKITPKPGMILSLNVEKDGQPHQVPVTVIEVKDDIVTVDYNHPLAGHHLTYDFSVIEIKKSK